jgi:hypothetical protein
VTTPTAIAFLGGVSAERSRLFGSFLLQLFHFL